MRLVFSFIVFALIPLVYADAGAAAEYAKANKVGTPNFAELGCKKGELWDPRNGGECWSCAGKKRTIFSVSGTKACETPASENLKSATRKSKDALSCGSGSFFDPRKGGECWSCPKGYKRSLAAVTAKDACTKAVKRKNKKAKYSYNTGSVFKACKKGTFANAGSTKCYKCSKGYRHDGGKKVSKSGVCYKRPYTAKKKASKIKSLTGLKCPKGQFFDPINNGSCWTCPKGYNRTAHAVTKSKACSKATAAKFAKASKKSAKKMTIAKVTSLGCKKGSFFDLTAGGSCWSCPKSNNVRTLYAVTSKKACASKTCGKIGGRPCYVWERYPSCDRGLLEDPFANKCVKPKDLACEGTVAVIKAFKTLTEEAKKVGKALSDDAIDAIPGARAVLRFVENQGEQLQKEQQKLMRSVDLSKVTKQFDELVANSPDEIRKMAEIAETVSKARTKIMGVFTNPNVICSGDGKRIAKALEKTGLHSMFASVDPSIWNLLNPISSAYAAKPTHQMSIELGVAPPLPGHLNGISIGIAFATDFKNNHSLTLPTISYARSIAKAKEGGTFDVSSAVIAGDVGLTLGWAYWDGVTNWGANDVFNWGASLDAFGPVHINIGSGGFGGISFTIAKGAYSKETVTDLFGVTTVTKTKKPEPPKFELSIGGAIGGGFNIPLK